MNQMVEQFIAECNRINYDKNFRDNLQALNSKYTNMIQSQQSTALQQYQQMQNYPNTNSHQNIANQQTMVNQQTTNILGQQNMINQQNMTNQQNMINQQNILNNRQSMINQQNINMNIQPQFGRFYGNGYDQFIQQNFNKQSDVYHDMHINKEHYQQEGQFGFNMKSQKDQSYLTDQNNSMDDFQNWMRTRVNQNKMNQQIGVLGGVEDTVARMLNQMYNS